MTLTQTLNILLLTITWQFTSLSLRKRVFLKRRPKNEDLRPKTPWTKTKTLWTKTKTPWTKTKTPWTKTKTSWTKTTDANR